MIPRTFRTWRWLILLLPISVDIMSVHNVGGEGFTNRTYGKVDFNHILCPCDTDEPIVESCGFQ